MATMARYVGFCCCLQYGNRKTDDELKKDSLDDFIEFYKLRYFISVARIRLYSTAQDSA